MSETFTVRPLTNKANLPEPVYRALCKDSYQGGGDISITRLIMPPRIVALRKKHAKEIVTDASDVIWSVMGQAGHTVMERSADSEMKVEERLFMPIQGVTLESGDNWTWQLSGQPDLYDTRNFALYDYKFTSVWTVLFGDKPEWVKQVNLQAMLHRHKGDRVERGAIIAFLRDWQARKARFERDYPQHQVMTINIPMWPQEEVVEYAENRVRLHQKSQQDFKRANWDPEALPLCTPDERWYRGHKFKVKKMNEKTGVINKKADRNFDSITDARQYMTDNALGLPKGKVWAPIEEVKGENIRCMDYCDVWQFCPFGRKLHEEATALVNENLPKDEDDND